ncbi:MAG: hypothetical protein M3220_02320 [Chloroflexota bacterium]|nr:hypothetical protein [Chloroflexota bacterium]
MAEIYNSNQEKLWDPKYAAVGVLVIALAIAVLDILPNFILSKINRATAPEENFPTAVALYDEE